MEYIKKKNTGMGLDFLGISPALLTISLVMIAGLILLIFAFIFLGINSFALGGTFGAIINSMLPLGIILLMTMKAGGATVGGKDDKAKDKIDSD